MGECRLPAPAATLCYSLYDEPARLIVLLVSEVAAGSLDIMCANYPSVPPLTTTVSLSHSLHKMTDPVALHPKLTVSSLGGRPRCSRWHSSACRGSGAGGRPVDRRLKPLISREFFAPDHDPSTYAVYLYDPTRGHGFSAAPWILSTSCKCCLGMH